MNTAPDSELPPNESPMVEIPAATLEWLDQLKPGDVVVRAMGGVVTLELIVDSVDDEFVYCGPWKFSKATSGEVDEELGFTATDTGSLIRPPEKGRFIPPNKPKKP